MVNKNNKTQYEELLEKVETYDKAFMIAKNRYKTEMDETVKTFLELMFPLLKEDEDEKIREEIINYFEHYPNIIVKRERKNDWIAWLEKQSEQKPDNEEMKELLRTEYEKGRADAISEMQKSAELGEEDKEQLDRAIYMMEQLDMTNSWDDVYNWLKSLKNRVQPQTKQEWSERDEKLLNDAISLADECDDIELRDWLKFLKDRVQSQPKQEWSEDDKYNHNIILYLLNNECVGVADKRIAIEWFKSLLNNC